MNGVLAELASQYQQLYLTPGNEAQYQEIVLKGKEAEIKSLSHFTPVSKFSEKVSNEKFKTTVDYA